MTPIRERALEMGWVCTTRLMPHPTASAAKKRKSKASIWLFRGPGHDEASNEQLGDGEREQEEPREPHQLIKAEPRERAADPDVEEENGADLGSKPEDGVEGFSDGDEGVGKRQHRE